MVGSWQVARQAKGVVWPVVRRVLRLLDRVHLSLARLVGDPHRTRGPTRMNVCPNTGAVSSRQCGRINRTG